MPIGEFRNRAGPYIRRAEQGETVVILNRGREVAVLGPAMATASAKSLLGAQAGTAEVRGDMVGPAIPAAEWFRT